MPDLQDPLPVTRRRARVGRLGRAAFLAALAGGSSLLGAAAAPADGEAPREARYAEHIRELWAKKIPHSGFSVVVTPPFVVIGDEPKATVARRAQGTVAWAVRLLKDGYFPKDPARVLDIWLFRNRQSYDAHNLELFGGPPGTPFGYYSSRHGALVMNIATGGGTLVHELVHPFMEANFPDCPAWLNEGLGSLYEQCREKDGKIWGLTNWRLANLQRLIRAKQLPSTESMVTQGDRSFYAGRTGDNYAHARYLCYYLQGKGKLREFYRRFQSDHRKDRFGLATLKAVLGTTDLAAFDRSWHAYVLKLRFGR